MASTMGSKLAASVSAITLASQPVEREGGRDQGKPHLHFEDHDLKVDYVTSGPNLNAWPHLTTREVGKCNI